MNAFERLLSVSAENIEIELRGFIQIPWLDLFLNPRRLRGSDFLMRWSQGVWSEKRLIQAVNETKNFFAIPYGPSGVAPTEDVREFELYFERLEQAGLGNIKRPDLLIFKKSEKNDINKIIKKLGGIKELPFIKEEILGGILDRAIIAVECENSLWVAEKMPDYNSVLKPQKRLGGKLGLKKSAVLPTIILKEEDRRPLFLWQNENKIKIHIWHVFYDRAFGLCLDRAQEIINEGLIQPTIQIFQAPGGATTSKTIYKFYYHYAYPVGISLEQPELISDFIEDKNGHILPYVRFKGGKLRILKEALSILNESKNERD